MSPYAALMLGGPVSGQLRRIEIPTKFIDLYGRPWDPVQVYRCTAVVNRSAVYQYDAKETKSHHKALELARKRYARR